MHRPAVKVRPTWPRYRPSTRCIVCHCTFRRSVCLVVQAQWEKRHWSWWIDSLCCLLFVFLSRVILCILFDVLVMCYCFLCCCSDTMIWTYILLYQLQNPPTLDEWSFINYFDSDSYSTVREPGDSWPQIFDMSEIHLIIQRRVGNSFSVLAPPCTLRGK